ncbi:serine/threonine-protein kinase [Streptomyces sp. NPDC053079]|uniref:serine/threonine-protein kinase n=1 Tax=Streptomyces sp. NPDC053079 TaxID=3365697 RepID=UPI0037D17465
MLVAGRYRLGEPLGRGGMGEVWQGHDEVLGRQVAVKLLLGDDGDESAAIRFRMEAQTAARLNHPQVVAVYDFGEWEGRFYLVMELVKGPSLAAELSAQGMLAVPRVADLAAQTASGLAAAHRQGVVHRDVKPGNLMVDASSGALKIGDFGIARFVDETSAGLTRAGQIVGTSTYLAPERALGRTAGPESDVYALGCVLYQLLVGRPPFWSDSPTTLLYMHVDTPPESPRLRRGEVPYAFEAYLLRMLAKQPEERPSAQEVADFFAGSSWQDTPQPLPPPVAPPVAPAAMPQAPFARPAAPAPLPRAPFAPPAVPPPAARQERTTTYAAVPAANRKRKVLLGATAGVVAFVAAALIGASLFESDSGSDSPRPAQAPSTAPHADLDPDAGPAQETRRPKPVKPSPSSSKHKKPSKPKSSKSPKREEVDDDDRA